MIYECIRKDKICKLAVFEVEDAEKNAYKALEKYNEN